MSEETPEIEPTESEEKPKRRRRRKAAPSAEASEASSSPEAAAASSGSEPAETSSPPEQRSEGRKRRSRRTAPRVAQGEDEAPAAEPQAAQDEDEAPTADEAPQAEAEPGADDSADVAPQAEEEQEPQTVEEEPEAGAEVETAEPEAEAPAAPAATPAPRRRRRRGELLDVEVRAQAKYVRSSARKARLVCDHIRGKSVEEARAILAHTPRGIARDWSKLLESAVANAEHNHELIGEDLYVKAVRADEGPTIKRYRPRALGRATRIRKRTSHLTILLKPKP